MTVALLLIRFGATGRKGFQVSVENSKVCLHASCLVSSDMAGLVSQINWRRAPFTILVIRSFKILGILVFNIYNMITEE